MLTPNQRFHIIFWVVTIVIAESIMLLLNRYLSILYVIIVVLFFGGFALRVLHLYPGKKEPLILDFSAVVISLLFAYAGEIFKMSPLRFLLILTSSLIILPHLIYIISKEDI